MELIAYAIDGVAPARLACPTDAEQVAELIGAAHRAREAVVLRAGGTRIEIGNSPSRFDIALDLTGVRGVIEHSAPDLVCIVRAGTTLAELQAALAPTRQRWPVDAAIPERATVGGTIASAAAAPSRLRHQHPRDWVIGCEAVLGDGTRVRAGGRVVKNVTGYDLSRLYSGSYGTLAAITEVSLKLQAVDESVRTLRVGGDPADLARIALRIRATLPVEGLVLASAPSPALYLRVAGLAAAVTRVAADASALATFTDVDDREWRALCDRPSRDAFAARVSVPPGHEPAFLSGDAVAYVGTGTAYLFGHRSVDEIAAMRSRCESAGGALVIERATADAKVALGVWGRRRSSERGVAAALKRRFDPNDVLAPGRMPV
ncbi:MAG TPA: FAD-binding protein [Candidatus Limnocylindrales bacterium]|nr:FAD-binding protein [Candidatus Limnocylindrales bacterium]